MEAFSLLKYWRGGGGGAFTRDSNNPSNNLRSNESPSSSSTTTTIVTAVSPSSSDSDDEHDNDDGPFFDLEFTLPADESDSEDPIQEKENVEPTVEEIENGNDKELADDDDDVSENENDGEEIKFTLSSSSSADSNDPNVTLSPSDDLFFKGRLVPIDTSSLILNASETIPKFPVSSILKSATKFRVQMLKFNKSKSNLREKPSKSQLKEKNQQEKEGQDPKPHNKFFTVKLKVEEVPLVSLFTRDNSSKASSNKTSKRDAENSVETNDSSCYNADEKKISKDVMHKYLKKVKPLYIRVSKRYGDKMRFSGQLSFSKSGAGPSPPSTAEGKSQTEKSTAVKGGGDTEGDEVAEVAGHGSAKSQKQGNLQAGLRVVCKHLGKSRSASSSVVGAAPPAPVESRRRDDSLLQQQDGIQSAILHCKRSFNASRDLEASILPRSVSDSSHEKSMN